MIGLVGQQVGGVGQQVFGHQINPLVNEAMFTNGISMLANK